MSDTTWTAWATDTDQSATLGRAAEGILIQGFVADDDEPGTQVYTGEDIELDGPTPEADAMDEVLRAAGWIRVSPWDTISGQHIARVERWIYTVYDGSLNVETAAGWRDTLDVKDGPETVDTISVESSDDPAPYVTALAAAGWTVTGTDSAGRWLVVRA